MKRPFVATLAIFVCLCASGSAQSSSDASGTLPRLLKVVRPAVMRLKAYDSQGNEKGVGSGFLVTADGKLITCRHVVENAHHLTAEMLNGGQFQIEGIFADDTPNDLAVLKVRGTDLPFLQFTSDKRIEVGEVIFVVGSPLGLEGTVSQGIVSAVRDDGGDSPRIQITAAISPGSSGSPVINLKGEVVAVAAFAVSGGQSLNFAIPANLAVALLKKAGDAQRLRPLSEHFQASIETSPEFKAYNAAYNDGESVLALKHARALIERFPQSARSRAYLANALFVMDFLEEALTAVEEGLKLDERDEELWKSMARVKAIQAARLSAPIEKRRKFEEASKAARRAVSLKPDDPGGWAVLSFTLNFESKYSDAVDAIYQAIKLEPEDVQHWDSLGRSLTDLGKYSEAIKAFRKALDLDPKYTPSIVGIANVHLRQNEYGAADSEFLRALEINPDDVGALLGMAWMYKTLGQRAKYEKTASALKTLYPNLVKDLDAIPWGQRPTGRMVPSQ